MEALTENWQLLIEFIRAFVLPAFSGLKLWLGPIVSDIQPGRLVESLIFLCVLLWRIKPHLTRVEQRMKGIEGCMNRLECSMTKGFNAGEQRFDDLEDRLTEVEAMVFPLDQKTRETGSNSPPSPILTETTQ